MDKPKRKHGPAKGWCVGKDHPNTKMTEEKGELLKNVCRLKPTLIDCAEIVGVDPSTIESYIRKNFNQTFREFRDQRMAWTRNMIIRNLIKQCENNNLTALIYCSKNLCGWSDKPLIEEVNFKDLDISELKAIVNKASEYIKEREEVVA